jgi:hypothetical protein
LELGRLPVLLELVDGGLPDVDDCRPLVVAVADLLFDREG